LYGADKYVRYAGNLDENALNTLRASSDVEVIAEDGIMHIMASITQLVNSLSASRL
jgi:cerevisin